MSTGQYYFSIDKLKEMLARFESAEFQKRVGGRELRGFVFTMGRTPEDKPCSYAFPVFTTPGEATASDTILYQNTDPNYSGCPYPPPCN